MLYASYWFIACIIILKMSAVSTSEMSVCNLQSSLVKRVASLLFPFLFYCSAYFLALKMEAVISTELHRLMSQKGVLFASSMVQIGEYWIWRSELSLVVMSWFEKKGHWNSQLTNLLTH